MIRGSGLRFFHSSVRRLNVVPVTVAKPVRRVGALRGGFTGFLLGVALTGAGAYYYLFDEYQAAQRAVLADVIALRESLETINGQIAELKKTEAGSTKQ